MASADLVFWSCISFHIGLTGSIAAYFQHRVKIQKITETKAKTFYSWLCLGVGMISIALTFCIINFFRLPAGHGEIFAGTILFNVVLIISFIIVGRIVIGWDPMKW